MQNAISAYIIYEPEEGSERRDKRVEESEEDLSTYVYIVKTPQWNGFCKSYFLKIAYTNNIFLKYHKEKGHSGWMSFITALGKQKWWVSEIKASLACTSSSRANRTLKKKKNLSKKANTKGSFQLCSPSKPFKTKSKSSLSLKRSFIFFKFSKWICVAFYNFTLYHPVRSTAQQPTHSYIM